MELATWTAAHRYTEAPHWILAPPFVDGGGVRRDAGGEVRGAEGLPRTDHALRDGDPASWRRAKRDDESLPRPSDQEGDGEPAALLQLGEGEARRAAEGAAEARRAEGAAEARRGSAEDARELLEEAGRLDARAVAARLRLEAAHRRVLSLADAVVALVEGL